MNYDQATLDKQATAMFDAMQRVLEDRSKPIVEAYTKDFYQLDRDRVAALFAPGGEYLWLLHPCGTHFGMIGILPAERTSMAAVIDTYAGSYAAERMEMHHIQVDANGETSMKQVRMWEATNLIQARATKFLMRGCTLYSRGKWQHPDGDIPLAQVSVKVTSRQGDHTYISKVDSGDRPLTRLQALAATMHAEMAATKLSDLFLKCQERLVNGVDLDTLFPAANIPETEPGKYAPSKPERERERG